MIQANSAGWPLTYKILAILSLALLPLGIAALIVSIDAHNDLERAAHTRAQLRAQTLASDVSRDIEQDLLMLEMLASTRTGTQAGQENCMQGLGRRSRIQAIADNAAIVDRQGQILCGNPDVATLVPLSLYATMHPDSTPPQVKSALVEGPRAGLIMISTRVAHGAPAGRVIALWPRTALDRHIQHHKIAGETIRLLWHTDSRPALPPADPQHILRVRVPVMHTPLQLEMTSPRPALEWQQALSVALPILMWLVGLIVCWSAVHRLVVRPLQMVRRTVNRYAAGDFTARIGQPRALQSKEMASLGKSFDSVAERIMMHEAEQSQAIATQKRLTREVHHRVKNNLQIIGSLLSIQAREAREPGALNAYAAMQLRVAALAIVHRWLFEHGAQEAVELRPLIHELCQSIEANVRDRNQGQVRMTSQVPAMRISQDIAVPIAFLITEMAAAAIDHDADDETQVDVRAELVQGHARLHIQSPLFQKEDLFAATSSHASARIAHGMARQLRGQLRYTQDQGCYSVAFSLIS